MTVINLPNPITEAASIFVDHYSKDGWPAAGQYYNTLKLPDQIKEQFKKEAQKEFNRRDIDVHIKL